MRETTIETYLRESVEGAGGICRKWVSPGVRGSADRLIFMPHGVFCLCEVKQPGAKPTPHQRRDHERFRKLGFKVSIVDSYLAVDNLVRELKRSVGMQNTLSLEDMLRE